MAARFLSMMVISGLVASGSLAQTSVDATQKSAASAFEKKRPAFDRLPATTDDASAGSASSKKAPAFNRPKTQAASSVSSFDRQRGAVKPTGKPMKRYGLWSADQPKPGANPKDGVAHTPPIIGTQVDHAPPRPEATDSVAQ